MTNRRRSKCMELRGAAHLILAASLTQVAPEEFTPESRQRYQMLFTAPGGQRDRPATICFHYLLLT
jgi:hypothetical protein